MILTIGIIILVGSIVLGCALAWLSSLNQTSGAGVMAALLLGCIGAALGVVLIGIGWMSG